MASPQDDCGTTLYRELAQTLSARIRTGQYAVGTLLPREVDLSVEFGVSRATVREALRLMELEHVIIRKRRLGTIVSGVDPAAPRHLGFNLPLSLEALSRDTRLVVFAREHRTVPKKLAAEIPEEACRSPWLYFAGVRRSQATDEPLSMTEIYLHPRLTTVARHVGLRPGLVYPLIEQECGEQIRQVKTRIEPCRLTRLEAERLEAPPGSLAMRLIQRISNEAAELLEVATGVYPAARFVFDASFTLP